jgi:oligopeptide transport system substrate-binding protein
MHDDKAVFYYNEAAGITSLDPAFARDQANIWAVNQLFNGLVQLDSALRVRPAIAHSWEISADGREYIFSLRQDVFFHDHPVFTNGKGRQVTAHDFVYSFNRILNTGLASPGAWVFNYVDVASGDGFTALSDTVFSIKLKSSFPPFISLLANQYCSVIPREAVEQFGKDFRINPVGTGPFKFVMWKTGIQLILHKNQNYFEIENGERLPHIDAISVSFISDKQSAFLEFLKGNLDFISGIDASYKDDLLTRKGALRSKYTDQVILITQPYLNTEYIGILVDPELDLVKTSPLREAKVRQAINYGFDRDKMIKYLRNNIGTPGTAGFVPKGLPSFDAEKVNGYNYNPVLARQLLAEAGFPNGAGLPYITLSTTASYADISEYIQSQLADIGVKIKLEVNQAATHREMVAKSKLNLFRGSWIADYPDAENYLALYYSPNHTPQGPNYTRFTNYKFDRLYEEAMRETNDSARYELYKQMDNMVMEEAPVIVLYYDQVIRLTHPYISGLGSNALNLLNLKSVKKRN